MTQTTVKTPRADPLQADREAFPVASGDTMKAMVNTHYGSPDVLQLKEVARPTPQDHEVLVHVRAASVNAAELHLLRGKPFLMRLMGFGLLKPKHSILGAAMAGRVEAVGRNVTQFQPGDEIFGDLSKCGFGAFAEYVCASEEALALKPATVTFEEAAAVPLAAVTALQGLRAKGPIQLGQQVLIYGAGGGVGTFAVQLAKAFGARVTAVCSTRNVDMVRSLGADQVIDYTQADFTTNGQRYDFIFAVNGYRSIFEYRRALNPRGVYVMIGGSMAAMVQAMLLGPVMSLTGRQKMGSMGVAKPNQKDLGFMKELLETGKVVPVIDRTYPLREVPEALRYLEKGHAQGKVIITMA